MQPAPLPCSPEASSIWRSSHHWRYHLRSVSRAVGEDVGATTRNLPCSSVSNGYPNGTIRNSSKVVARVQT
jgi:hypothetical protein